MANLTLLCGIPASSKSTYAAKFKAQHPNATVISSDALRAMMGTDETDQNVSSRVFETMEAIAHFWLLRDTDVLVDATNTTIKARTPFLKLARYIGGVTTKAVVFPIALDEAKRRNAARSRVVPEHVLDRMHNQFQTPTLDEVDSVELVN